MLLGLLLLVGTPASAQQKVKNKKGKDKPVAAGTAEERTAALRLLSIPSEASGIIRLPLRIVVARDLAMSKKGVEMNAWITSNELARVVVPELNRIWRPAKIEWVIESVVDHRVSAETQLANKAGIQQILNSQRDESGKSDPERVPLIKTFFDPALDHPAAQTLHLFPYMGTTSQGVAAMGGTWSYLGMWTDKPSGGTRPPQRTLLMEPLPMRIGSLGRTFAHELGHNMGLPHPKKDSPIEGMLMGGRKQAYTLTAPDIATARSTALALANRISNWAKRE